MKEVIFLIADGHIHTPFCPHGTSDQFEEYIEWAINHQLEEISFTEHAPLPNDFIDTTPTKDSAMSHDELSEYIEQLGVLKEKYKQHIHINVGLEIDYIAEYEQATTEWLDKIGHRLDDSILSVHFIKVNDHYYCIDYSPDYFSLITEAAGSVDQVYELYYATLKKAILSNLGTFKPKRIGHLTLARKFQLKYPSVNDFHQTELELLQLIKTQHLALDYNGAGVSKEYYKQPYPPSSLVKEAISLGIPLVYGSDAHRAQDLGQGYEQLHEKAVLVKPSQLYR